MKVAGPEGPDADRRWFKKFGARVRPSDVRLLCFHHAGGSAAMFRPWARLIPESVELIAVQLPGRADRFSEPAFDRMGPLVEELVEVAKPLLDRPFACYGVSMGARVAWAFAHILRDRSMPQPCALFVASNAAPCHDNGVWEWDEHPGGIEGYMREMGGTPPEVLAQPELMRALVPVLRADLAVLSTHRYVPAVALDMPIRAFAGLDDATSPPERMAGWAAETTGSFRLTAVRAGHFFDADAERDVLRLIVGDL
jgi:medium-chain acyl-[acyl-carrier-protein] hydrolase